MVEKLGCRLRDLDSQATPHTTVISADMGVLLDACDRVSPKLQKRLKLAEEGARLGSYAPLAKKYLARFEGSEDLDTFFTPRERVPLLPLPLQCTVNPNPNRTVLQGRLLSYILDEEGGLINVYRDGTCKLKALQVREGVHCNRVGVNQHSALYGVVVGTIEREGEGQGGKRSRMHAGPSDATPPECV